MMTKAKLKTAMTMMAHQNNGASDVAEQHGMSLSTLDTHVGGEGRPKPLAAELLRSAASKPRPAGPITSMAS